MVKGIPKGDFWVIFKTLLDWYSFFFPYKSLKSPPTIAAIFYFVTSQIVIMDMVHRVAVADLEGFLGFRPKPLLRFQETS